MRSLLHLLSILLVLPSVVLAAAFIMLGRAIAAQSLPALLLQLLEDVLFVFPWGLLAAVAMLLSMAVAGFFAQTRRAAGLGVAVLGIGSIVILISTIVGHSRLTLDEIPFFIPGGVATCIGLWLALADRAGRDPRSEAVADARSGH